MTQPPLKNGIRKNPLKKINDIGAIICEFKDKFSGG
jgi:hypothetical protein